MGNKQTTLSNSNLESKKIFTNNDSLKVTQNSNRSSNLPQLTIEEQIKTIRPVDTNYKKHLVVDDSNYNRDVLSGYLKRLEIECDKANNGVEAITLFSNDNKYDIIWMDIKMPLMNGTDAMRKIRSMGFKGLVIGLTGAVEIYMIQEYIESGIDMILPKPIDRNNLFDLIGRFYK